MFLHIGGEKMVGIKDIIAILDGSKIINSPISRRFLEKSESRGFLDKEAETEVKSIIVTSKIIYLSPIAASTLLKRTLELAKDKPEQNRFIFWSK